jgi:hypothetical protein
LQTQNNVGVTQTTSSAGVTSPSDTLTGPTYTVNGS